MGSIALGSPWLQPRSGFPIGSIALRSPWLIQIRISHGAIALGSPWLIQIVLHCALPDFVDSESDLHLFCMCCQCWCHQEVTLPKHTPKLPRSIIGSNEPIITLIIGNNETVIKCNNDVITEVIIG